MAVRGDIHVEWYRSPRVIIVEAPSTELDIQDLVDTMVEIETAFDALDDPGILKSFGKQDLGTVLTGITAVLDNAQLAFEQRVTPSVSGTATSAPGGDGLPGQILEDTVNDLSGTDVGDTIFNMTDGSLTTVIQVIDANKVRHYPLSGGALNVWTPGDSYRIYPAVECTITGGNLAAVDDQGQTMPAQVSMSFVSYIKEAAVSGALHEIGSGVTQEDKEDIADLVWDETLADHESAGSVGAAVTALLGIEAGCWEIDGSDLVFCDKYDQMEIARFALKDAQGQPVDTSGFVVHSRMRILS